ncbi:MAG: hypothetical protein M3487_03355 [Actinomycetota bacterium]|nr:hypothetical protein [Acidimicrobiia bacterium]MDQ3468800.1 hypothetical protein [Actinomycetota bacterium]
MSKDDTPAPDDRTREGAGDTPNAGIDDSVEGHAVNHRPLDNGTAALRRPVE